MLKPASCAINKAFYKLQITFGSPTLQLIFPKAKLLLMSVNQENINDWYHSLSATIR